MQHPCQKNVLTARNAGYSPAPCWENEKYYEVLITFHPVKDAKDKYTKNYTRTCIQNKKKEEEWFNCVYIWKSHAKC